ncbi:MAG: hypothetical protein ACLQMF_15615 [Rectinemataceae bacterium]
MARKYKATAIPVGLFALTFLFGISLLSCAHRRPESLPPQLSGAGGASKPAPQSAEAGPAVAPLPTATTSLGPEATLAASLRAYGLGADHPILPEDFDIGALQDLRKQEGAAKDILPVVQKFIAGLSAGTLNADLIDPAVRPALSLLLEPSDKLSPASAASYRIGSIEVTGDSASLEIGIPNKESKNEIVHLRGRLSLGLSDGRWYIEAFVLDRGPAPDAEKDGAFDPDTLQQTP